MTLHFYFARKFVTNFLLVFLVFAGLFVLIDMVEQLRKFGDHDVAFSSIIRLTLLNVPSGIYGILPLIVILSTLSLYLGLARSSELVVTRASGRSAINSLAAPVCTAFVIGVFAVAALNPIVAVTQREYEVTANKFRRGTASVLSISNEGLWLRQGSSAGQTVIRAAQSNLDGTLLHDITFMTFDSDGTPIERIEAKSAALNNGAWQLTDTKSWSLTDSENPERDARFSATLIVPSELTREQIRDSFGEPSAIPIWDLPAFINSLERAGFSARKHRVWFNMELALPLMLVSMVLVGAGFTMRHTRFGRVGVMVLSAILMGFGLFLIRNFAQILGENGQIPILVAAWSPPVAGIFMALALLLHLEDG